MYITKVGGNKACRLKKGQLIGFTYQLIGFVYPRYYKDSSKASNSVFLRWATGTLSPLESTT
jgi:hypothetical protein